MKIDIVTIPHSNQRYNTPGDYLWEDENTLIIYVSESGNKDYNFLVAIHELVEAYLCERRGIKEPDIMAFDINFEKERIEGKHTKEDEPGFSKNAPYRKEHTFATAVEMLVAEQLNIDWNEYDKTILAL